MQGYSRGRKECKPCEDVQAKLSLLTVVAAILLPLALLYLTNPSAGSLGPRLRAVVERISAAQILKQGGTLCKILLGWYQSLVVLGMMPQLQLPTDLEQLLTWLQDNFSWAALIDAIDIVPLECLLPGVPVNFYMKLVVTMVLPLLLFQLLLMLGMVAACLSGLRQTQVSLATPQLYRLGFWLLMLIYPQVSSIVSSAIVGRAAHAHLPAGKLHSE